MPTELTSGIFSVADASLSSQWFTSKRMKIMPSTSTTTAPSDRDQASTLDEAPPSDMRSTPSSAAAAKIPSTAPLPKAIPVPVVPSRLIPHRNTIAEVGPAMGTDPKKPRRYPVKTSAIDIMEMLTEMY